MIFDPYPVGSFLPLSIGKIGQFFYPFPPSPLKIADVLNGWSLMIFQHLKVS